MEQRELLDPFGFLVYANWPAPNSPRSDSGGLCHATTPWRMKDPTP
jgi:hypothetical protein